MFNAGLGLANLAGGAFSAYPTVGGFSRSAVNADSGAVSGMRQVDLVYAAPEAVNHWQMSAPQGMVLRLSQGSGLKVYGRGRDDVTPPHVLALVLQGWRARSQRASSRWCWPSPRGSYSTCRTTRRARSCSAAWRASCSSGRPPSCGGCGFQNNLLQRWCSISSLGLAAWDWLCAVLCLLPRRKPSDAECGGNLDRFTIGPLPTAVTHSLTTAALLSQLPADAELDGKTAPNAAVLRRSPSWTGRCGRRLLPAPYCWAWRRGWASPLRSRCCRSSTSPRSRTPRCSATCPAPGSTGGALSTK